MSGSAVDARKFDPKKLAKLIDPKRLERENPDLIWDTLALKDPRVLVDIGAGTGFFAVPFSRKLPRGKVYACDISEIMLAWMKDHLPPDCRGKVIPLKMEESTVPLPENTADLVFTVNLHHELEAPEELLREAHRLLKPGGTLAVIDWKKEPTGDGPPLATRVAEATVAAQMEASGFTGVTRHAVLPCHSFLVGTRP